VSELSARLTDQRRVEFRYELRSGDEIVATGHVSHDQRFEVGEEVKIGVRTGTVSTVEPILGERELRLVVQLKPEPGGE
jgi:hypothetical protein